MRRYLVEGGAAAGEAASKSPLAVGDAAARGGVASAHLLRQRRTQRGQAGAMQGRAVTQCIAVASRMQHNQGGTQFGAPQPRRLRGALAATQSNPSPRDPCARSHCAPPPTQHHTCCGKSTMVSSLLRWALQRLQGGQGAEA